MIHEPTIQDVLDVLNTFAQQVDGRFERFEKMEGELREVKEDIRQIKAVMVTKDYLDNKLADLKGDLIIVARKSNTKFSALVDELVDNKQMDKKVAARLLAMEPFPRS